MKFQKISKIHYLVVIFILYIVVFGTLFKNFFTNVVAQFLNVNKPIEDAEVLLVEGWMNNTILKYVKKEFFKRPYKYILVSGMESQLNSVQNKENEIYAWSVAQSLIDIGIDPAKIKVSACHLTSMHKTFSMALAAKTWFSLNDPSVRCINICSAWSHGKKTLCAYKKVIGKDIRTGILTFPEMRKPVFNWFLSSAGFKYQLYSFTGYIYVFLWPVGLVDL